MTLVAAVAGEIPVLMGDILLSRRVQSPVTIPGRSNPEAAVRSADGFYVSGLTQKLAIIRPWFAMGWAGSYQQASTFIRWLYCNLPKDIPEISHLFLKINEYDQENLSECDMIFCYGDLDRGFATWLVDSTTKSLIVNPMTFGDINCYAVGSGIPDLVKVIDTFQIYKEYGDISRNANDVATAMGFMALSMQTNFDHNGGFENAWGAGFEVLSGSKDGFKKLDNFVVIFSASEIDGISHAGYSMYCCYVGHHLVMIPFTPKGEFSAHFISPSRGSKYNLPNLKINRRLSGIVHAALPHEGEKVKMLVKMNIGGGIEGTRVRVGNASASLELSEGLIQEVFEGLAQVPIF